MTSLVSTGGYSTNNAFHAKFDWGFQTQAHTPNDEETISFACGHDANALYASCTLDYSPYTDFRTYKEGDPFFREIQENLAALNLEYFEDLSHERKLGVLITCELEYDKSLSLPISMDLSMFPKFEKTKPEQLTKDQMTEAILQNRNLEKAPPKLVSKMSDCQVTEFLDNLLFLIVMMSVKVKSISEMTVFRHSKFMAPYISHLQKARASSSSEIEGKIIKNLGNVLVGIYIYIYI